MGLVVRCGSLVDRILTCTLRGFDASESIPNWLHAFGWEADKGVDG